MPNATELDAAFRWFAASAVADLGFLAVDPFDLPIRASVQAWFIRPGSHLATELVLFAAQWRPKRVATCEVLASPLSPSELRVEGFSGRTAVGTTPYLFQLHHLWCRRPELLGDDVPLPPGAEWEDTFARWRKR